jgi:hypothetical protein
MGYGDVERIFVAGGCLVSMRHENVDCMSRWCASLCKETGEGRVVSVCNIFCTEYGRVRIQVVAQKEKFKAIRLIVTLYYLKCQ